MTSQTVITEWPLTSSSAPFLVDENVCRKLSAPKPLSLFCFELQNSGRNQPRALSLEVCSIGTEADRILQQCQQGKVLAVFSRSVYLHSDQGVFCVGLASIGRGPLHVQLASDSDGLFAALDPGSLVSFGGVVSPVYCGSVNAVDQALVPTAEHCRCLLLACVAPPVEQGFGWLLDQRVWLTDADGHELAELSLQGLDVIDRGLRVVSVAAIECLFSWLRESLSSASEGAANAPESQILALLGAGPGLTPAGDDLLAGVMLALHRLHRSDLAGRLWQVLEPSLPSRTNIISSAHLRMAAQARCAEPVQLLLEHFISEATCRSATQSLFTLADSIGGSSGWDTLAGMSLVVRAISISNDD